MRFHPDDSTGWGSRKEELVDKLGDPDSIFEKINLLIERLPDIFKPRDWKRSFMKVVNRDNGATITGESGDNIGRGGRKTRYFKDESAHYERPELIEAALGDNTDVQIDISSVNGLGNVFHRRREAGVVWEPGCAIEPGLTRVFIADWRDHPEKTQEWYDRRKAKAEREGMQHVFAQEVDRNYSAAIQNTIIAYEWIEACVDAHLEVPCMIHEPSDEWMAGLDLTDEGGDKHALVLRQGIVLRNAEEWGDDDPGEAARKTIRTLKGWGRRGVPIQYDCIAIGATVKSEYNRLVESGELDPADYPMVPWHAGAAIQEPFARVIPGDDESPTNRDFFMNMKAQAWWSMRTRCYKTWRARKFGDVYALNELMSIDGSMPRGMLEQLKKELAQATRAKTTGLKLVIEKKPTGTRSPNLADSAVQCYFPAPLRGGQAFQGSYGA
jgi:phage terminase large subunit